ncbi:hypothetical protein Ddye_027140 [Dipteronia dyeriana]|uniref:F-box domain-containing protein n=1 Tax=Dipteronia dyeriana TaxID=168575 RepID=A0AAD9WR70_9ROSI|nr:hypothetical protein Ddye_027140 [Dipteronia dyeriana]
MGESETTTDVSVDQFSELPPFIIHHIMSRLSVKQSAQTSILSKRWKALYTSFPILDFYESYTYFTGQNRWLILVVENNVKELDFEVQTNSTYRMYTLSQTIYFAKSITSLKLGGCKLELPYGDIRLYALKSLSLDKVCVTEEMLQKLISRCSLLEDLHLSFLALKHIYISKPQNLNYFDYRVSI